MASNVLVICCYLFLRHFNDSKVHDTFTIIYTIANVKFIYFKFVLFNLYYHL